MAKLGEFEVHARKAHANLYVCVHEKLFMTVHILCGVCMLLSGAWG